MFWNILKNDIVRGMFKRKYLYIIATIVIVVLVIATDIEYEKKNRDTRILWQCVSRRSASGVLQGQ